ncbi:hypothetical protein [Nocardia suismassiliense]|uniref:hypothetical protein n=1 Tax=Nocardia suismassiliense TaxID=2077092 RepID=UPI000D1E224F|nr:hypothetical protein [Nocardia suismassiliense]
MLTACVGSAAGAALLFLGSAAGSGLIGPGILAPPWWAVGSAGSALLPPASGSSGSAIGSGVVGSAMAGSAVVTCLLTLSTVTPPPTPSLPLLIPSPIPIPNPPFVLPVSAPVATPESATAAQRLPVAAATPPAVTAEAAPTSDLFGWNTLEIVVFIVVLVLVAIQGSAEAARKRQRQ